MYYYIIIQFLIQFIFKICLFFGSSSFITSFDYFPNYNHQMFNKQQWEQMKRDHKNFIKKTLSKFIYIHILWSTTVTSWSEPLVMDAVLKYGTDSTLTNQRPAWSWRNLRYSCWCSLLNSPSSTAYIKRCYQTVFFFPGEENFWNSVNCTTSLRVSPRAEHFKTLLRSLVTDPNQP